VLEMLVRVHGDLALVFNLYLPLEALLLRPQPEWLQPKRSQVEFHSLEGLRPYLVVFYVHSQ